jgi:hypothetical protein
MQAFDWWRQPQVMHALGLLMERHLVSLEVIIKTERGFQRALYSGFLYEHRGFLFWITAGHCLDEIGEIRQHPKVEVVVARWHDKGSNIKAADAVPITLSSLGFVTAGAHGYDVGAVLPSLNAQMLFRAGGRAIPFTPESWIGANATQRQGYYILGYPDEARDDIRVETDDAHFLNFMAKAVSLATALDLPPDHFTEPPEFWGKTDSLYGRIELTDEHGIEVLEKIEGMSGGPVVSVDREQGGVRYRLVGIQSSWLRQSRIVRVEKFENVVALIEAWFHAAGRGDGTQASRD